MTGTERTVHATGVHNGIPSDVVRRGGRWYVEYRDGFHDRELRERRPVDRFGAVVVAESMAIHGGAIHFDQPGGRTFDKALEHLR